MERGIYFDGWYHNNHCYHPSLPYRSMQMVEDLEKYKATILVWSVMGGGSISLPYLENEAFGELDPRLRFYGFMNDSEFVAECKKRGIKAMGIVFEVQGWEFPVEVSPDGKHMKQFNVLREGKPEHYYGLNEFANGKYDGLFRTSLKDYYPDGIVNSDGQIVTNLQEEVAARTWKGEPVHAGWVEVVNHSRTCYQTCRNNPVWRDYLKKVMAIQIDAGVEGIQLDEAELPITSMGAGGCFCKDCMKQFRTYLQGRKKAGTLDPKLYKDIDLDTFDYRQYVLDGGYQHPNDSPLMRDYYEFQMRAVKKHFTELVDFARDYAKKKYNRDLWLSGNFFTCMPVYYPFENTVDVVITEMDHTLFRQPHWYRYISGFSGKKPIIVAENPYGGIIPMLAEKLENGKGYDLYRLLQLEANVYGCNMSVPYGGWMGNTIKTGFWPPRDVTEEVQTFLCDHDDLYSKDSSAKILVPYSFPSYYWREVTKNSGDQFTDVNSSILAYQSLEQESDKASRLPFWDTVKYLSEQQTIYDVCMFGDDDLRPDQVHAEDWKQYELIILPECTYLTENQCEELEKYVRAGGKLILFGKTAENHFGWAERVSALDGVSVADNPEKRREAVKQLDAAFRPLNEQIAQVTLQTEDDSLRGAIGVHMHRNGEKTSVHLLNYRYSEQTDRVETIPGVTVKIKVDENVTGAKVYGLGCGNIDAQVNVHEGIMTVKLDLPLYAVIELEK